MSIRMEGALLILKFTNLRMETNLGTKTNTKTKTINVLGLRVMYIIHTLIKMDF